MRKLFLIIAILVIAGCQKRASDQLAPPEVETKSYKFFNQKEKRLAPKHEPGVVTFKLKNNSSLKRVAGKSTPQHVYTKAMQKANDRGYFKVKVQDEQKTLSELRKNPDVQWASLNYAEVTQAIPDDPYWSDGSLWGLLHINMPTVWNSGNFGNKNVVVGVIDEGIFSHDDLCANIWQNPYELDNGIDDDGNGYIDDFHGWNWFDGNNQIYMGSDDHGTHVAGTIGAKSGNQIGVASINPNITLISCKFLNGYGYDDNAVRAIDYLIDLKTRHGINVKVTSNSWGGGGYNPALIEAIERAKNADILFVAAAGNADNNNDVNPSISYPSAYPNENIIAVGASDWQNNKASFSSYGKTTVDIFAPGTGIVSTVPSSQHTSTYAFYSGTSMATPHVSGACALYAAINTDANWQTIKTAILGSVQVLPQLEPYCATSGLLNVANILGQTPESQPPFYDCPVITPDQTPPSVPQFEIYEVGFDPTPGAFYGGYVAMRWTKGIDPEGQSVYYIVTKDDVDFWAVYSSNDIVSIVFAGFDDTSQAQVWKVRAIDTWGNQSNYSNTDTADWSQEPPPPADTEPPSVVTLTVNNPTTSSLNLQWTEATDNSGSVVYDIYRDGTLILTSATGTAYTNTGLSPGTTYSYYVKPRDPSGNTSQSNTVQGTTLQNPPPPPPPSYSVTVNNLSVQQTAFVPLTATLSWTTQTNGTISNIRIERKKGGSTELLTTLPATATDYVDNTIPGPGQYTYIVTAVLSQGPTGSAQQQIQIKKK